MFHVLDAGLLLIVSVCRWLVLLSRPSVTMMSENLEQSDDVPHEVEPPREEDGHCPLPFR